MLAHALRSQCRVAASPIPRIAGPIASTSALTLVDIPTTLPHHYKILRSSFSTSQISGYPQQPFKVTTPNPINKKRLKQKRYGEKLRKEEEIKSIQRRGWVPPQETAVQSEERTDNLTESSDSSQKRPTASAREADNRPLQYDGLQVLTKIPFTSDLVYNQVTPPSNTLGRSSELPPPNDAPVYSSSLVAANLLPSTTEGDLRRMFANYGWILDVLMPKSPNGQSKGIAHIQFKTPRPVQQILAEHEQVPFKLGDHTLDLHVSQRKERMSRAVKATLFVGNLPFYAQKEDIRALFADIADVIDITHGCGARGDTQGYAHVGFASQEVLQSVLERHRTTPFVLKHRTLRLEEATMGDRNPSWDPDPSRKSFRKEPEPSRALFVSGFDARDTEEVIKTAFSSFGAIYDVELLYAPNGLSRGLGYVTYNTLDDAMKVREEHKKDPITFNNIPLNLDYALPKEYSKNSPYKVLYVRRLRGYKRELKWYFFTHNQHIRKMIVHRQHVPTEYKTAMVVFKHVKYAKAAKEALDKWREEDSTVPEVYYGVPSQYEQSLWRKEEEELFGMFKGKAEHTGVYGLKDRTVLARHNHGLHPRGMNQVKEAYMQNNGSASEEVS